MTKQSRWRTLKAVACGLLLVSVYLVLRGVFLSSKPVARKPSPLAEKPSPDGEWCVTVWERSSWAAWAEVHDNTLNRTVRVDLSFDADLYYPKWWFSRIEMDGERATLGSQAQYDEDGNRSDRWITARILRRDLFVQTYSGKFQVQSDFPETIQIVDWSDEFGAVQPPKGKIEPRIAYGSRHKSLEQVPDSVSVEWYPESDPDNHRRQTISVADVIPLGQQGLSAFRLDREGEWRVRFILAD